MACDHAASFGVRCPGSFAGHFPRATHPSFLMYITNHGRVSICCVSLHLLSISGLGGAKDEVCVVVCLTTPSGGGGTCKTKVKQITLVLPQKTQQQDSKPGSGGTIE